MRERRTFLYLCAGLAFLGVLPPVWPTGLYLVLTSAILLGLEVAKLCEEGRWGRSDSAWNALALNCLKGLRDAATGVVAGIGLVCVAQLLLQTFLSRVSAEEVRAGENWIADRRIELAWLLDFRWVFISASVLFLASLIWPARRAIAWLKHWRTWASRGLVTLTTISAFTFFTSTAIDGLEREWIAGRKTQLQRDAGRIKVARGELLIRAYTKTEIDRLPASTKAQIREVFRATAKPADDSTTIVSDLAGRFGKDMPPPAEAGRTPSGSDRPSSADTATHTRPEHVEERPPVRTTDEAIDRIEKWDNLDGGGGESLSRTFRTLDGIAAYADRLEGTLAAARLLVEEAVKNVLGAQFSPAMDPLVKVFAKSLLSSGVKTVLSTTFPQGIDDVSDAIRWLKANLGAGQARPDWTWQVGTVAEYRDQKTRERQQLEELRQGLAAGWVASRNPEGKVFVHEARIGQIFVRPRYLIKESLDGLTWGVYRMVQGLGATDYGEKIGEMSRPQRVSIVQCFCR